MPDRDESYRPDSNRADAAAAGGAGVDESGDSKQKEPQHHPRQLATLHHAGKMQREWFARLRIREDRLARLWVSNLTGHDVVVWSRKEKRWVALLAVPELRRAINRAQSEMPRDGRPSSASPARLSRPPDSLPPTPPLAFVNGAVAGVGELRLRSIAQQQTEDRQLESANRIRKSFAPFLQDPRADGRNTQRRLTRQDLPATRARATARSKSWHWHAAERIVWVAAGVLAMFMVSGAGSADQHPERQQTPELLLTADRTEPSWYQAHNAGSYPSLGDFFAGPPRQCLANGITSPAATAVAEGDARSDNPERDAVNIKQRAGSDRPKRFRSSSASSLEQEPSEPQPNVPADLNFPAIRAALFNAAALARACSGESISGKVVITFDSKGTVRDVDVPLLVGERPDRDCVVRSFKSLRVPPFTGRPIAVKKDF